MNTRRYDVVIKPDSKRVLYRSFNISDRERIYKIISRIQILNEDDVENELNMVMTDFHKRHQKLLRFFYKQYDKYKDFLITDVGISRERKLLIGAYFTQEYSFESSALFNPSFIWHPDQSNLADGYKRFIVSLRATGEGHISSITFRSGLIDRDYNITIDAPSLFVTEPNKIPNKEYEKKLFYQKLQEVGLVNNFSEKVLSSLEDFFNFEELHCAVEITRRQNNQYYKENSATADGIISLGESNYEIVFSPDDQISEKVIFPSSSAESNGIEDARFVEFTEDDGTIIYMATYTAFDGSLILPQIMETPDFNRFKIYTLNGPAIENKGMALFPRKIKGKYAMISRQDNENIYIMFSDSLHFWYNKQILLKPSYPWEFIQMGNCGSPIETEKGWLVLSHGVGPVRRYVISAFLLDLENPEKVIGRLDHPILTPNENEREGYVPNVVYSCGAGIYNDKLIIPYAMSDYASTFATLDLNELLNQLVL